MDWLNEAHGSVDFGYDAIESTKNRKPPKRRLTTEDKQLRQTGRDTLQSTIQDMRRNEVAARWVLSKHIDFVVKHNFQPNTGDKAIDDELKRFYTYASRKENFDISGRYNLNNYMRLAEKCRLIDGDFYSVRQRGGYLQAIEGDRIRTPYTSQNRGVTPSDTTAIYDSPEWVNGVRVDATGRHKAYAIHTRMDNSFIFEREVSAKKVIPLGFWDRFDQTRGISPLAAVVNTMKDLNESYDYALAKAKVASLLALAITREASLAIGDEDDNPADRSVNFDKGAMILDLDDGEDAKFLTAATPENATQDFWKDMIGMVLKSLNIPYSFWDESYTNFNGSRTALILYLRSCEKDREAQVAFRDDWLQWRLKLGILRGEVSLPSTFQIDPSQWLWVPDGLQYWDTMKEASADIALIEAGLRSRTEIRRERYGDEWSDVAATLGSEKELMEELNILPMSMTPPPEPEPLNGEDSSNKKEKEKKDGE